MKQTIVVKCIILFFSLVNTVYLCAHTESLSKNSPHHFSNINSAQSLNGIVINDIVKDNRGFMWFATIEGLVRYDGHKLKVYESDPTDIHSLSNNMVNCIQVDPSGTIWVATHNGLNRFDPVQETFERFYYPETKVASEHANRINKVLLDRENNLWVGTYVEGLFYFDTYSKQFTRYSHDPEDPNSIRSNQVYSLALDHDGMLWIGGGNKGSLQSFDPVASRFTQVLLDDPAVVFPEILDIEIRDNHEIWCGTWNEGIYIYQPDDGTIVNLRHDEDNPNSINGNIIQNIYEDENGKIWLSVRSIGIDILDPSTNQYTHLHHDSNVETSIPGNTVLQIYGDDKGLIWFSTVHNGVFYYDPEFVYFELIQSGGKATGGLSSNGIYSLLCDHDDRLWIGTHGGGINIFDREQNTFSYMQPDQSTENSISTSSVTALYEDSNNNVWIGNWNTSKILDVYDPDTNTFTHFETEMKDDNIFSTTVRTIEEDYTGNIWVGTADNGLYVIDPISREMKQYIPIENDPGSISSTSILRIFEDQKQRIWIGTENSGVCRYDPETDSFVSFRHMNDDSSSISSDKVQYIYEDSEARVWFGTDNGINRWDEQRENFERFFYRHGFEKIDVKSIVEDEAKRFWISTKKGTLLCLDSDFDIRHTFTRSNGVQPLEFTSGSVCKTRNGLLCFAGLYGLNIVDPGLVVQNQQIPPVVVTSLSTLEEDISLPSFSNFTQPFLFSHFQNYLKFTFAALSYSQSGKNQFAYKLYPVDDDWRMIGSEQDVSFTALEPGEYTFHVKASDHQGNWNNKGVSVPFVIYPPWWDAWWFRITFFIAFGLLIAAYFMGKTYQIRANNRKLALEVERQTRSISQLNTNLVLSNEELKDALAHIKTLKGIIPICASCKKIRDDEGYWQQVESYVSKHSDAEFSHGFCPECYEKTLKALGLDEDSKVESKE